MVQEVLPFIQENNIQTIVTFDRNGVSGHPNHKNIHAALPLLRTLAPYVTIYTLQSKPLYRKFFHLLDCVLTLRESPAGVTAVDTPTPALRAMLSYPSQFVWYRLLFLLFSTYPRLNTLEEF